MSSIVLCKGFEINRLAEQIVLPNDSYITQDAAEIQQQLKSGGLSHIIIIVAEFEPSIADLLQSAAKQEIETQVYTSDRKAYQAYRDNTRDVLLLDCGEAGIVTELEHGHRRIFYNGFGKESTPMLRVLRRIDRTGISYHKHPLSLRQDLYALVRQQEQQPVKAEEPPVIAQPPVTVEPPKQKEKKKKPAKEKKPKKPKEKPPKKAKGLDLRVKVGDITAVDKRTLNKLQGVDAEVEIRKKTETKQASSIEDKEEIEQVIPVPVPEELTDDSHKKSSVGSLANLFQSFGGKETKSKITLVDKKLSLQNVQIEELEEDIPLEIGIDTNRFAVHVYKSPIEYLIGKGKMTEADHERLLSLQAKLKREKNLNMEVVDLAIVSKTVPEADVIRAMVNVYNVDFISYDRLQNMPLITNVYPKNVCKKYVFLHTKENPRVLVAQFENRLVSNLGQNFGNATILYSLSSNILARINSEEVWEHEGSGLSD